MWVREESGISSFRSDDTLAQRALYKLTGESRLLTQFDPDLIPRRDHERFKYLWPADKTAIKPLELGKNFPRYDYLPMLTSQSVLQDSIAWDVSRGLIAYRTGTPESFDKIHIDKHLPSAQCVLSERAWLLDASIARERITPPSVPDEGDDPGNKPDGGMPPEDDGPTLPGDGKRMGPKPCTKVGVEVELQPSDWRQFHTSVIKPLVDKGANIKISVRLSASIDDGFDIDFIELSIRESVLQINPTARIETDPK